MLTTNRLHFHYGCGSMTRKSPLLERETPAGVLFINPVDAKALQLQRFAPIGVRSRRGYLETRAMITDDVPPGLVSMPYHFKEAPSNQLTNTAQDPLTKMPELKACAVSVFPLPPPIKRRKLRNNCGRNNNMQQYLLESLYELQAHLSHSRQFYQVVDNDGDPHWQQIEQDEVEQEGFQPLTHKMPLSSAKGFFFAEQEPLYVFDGQFFRETLPKPDPLCFLVC